jgi:site-specific DNA-methyltransferase (adenine-specific)
MDSIFDLKNFKNEIVWSYKRYTAKSYKFQKLHDIILFFSKSKKMNFNEIRIDYGSKSGKMDSHYKQDSEGKWFRWQKRKGKEPYKIYLSEGKRLGDVWDLPLINASSRERLGYPTQKPEKLLERIIKASSNECDTVLDPFCGCGTTISVAQRLNRNWIGIDITHLAINLIKHRLKDTFGEDISDKYEPIGEPVDLAGAKNLADEDKYQFQWWALGLVGARPAEKKKGADKGIDGKLFFYDDPINTKAKQVVFQVKSGHIGVSQIRDLRGVIDRENAEIGVFISIKKPTREMIKEAASAGFYKAPSGKNHPRIQLLTISELLKGKKVDCPSSIKTTFKKAKPNKEKKQKNMMLAF